MSFLAPLFLAGLAAVAIPLLVHLTHRERREPVVFPSLMFLERIPFRTQRRQRIRHLPLLLLRALVVALLAAGFARPFLRSSGASAPAGSRLVVVLLDRSASMAARGRWERAIAAARREMASLDAGDRLGLVAFDTRAETLAPPSPGGPGVSAALDRVRPSAAAGRLAPALRLAAAILEREGGAGEVVLISDFQRTGWRDDAPSALPRSSILRVVDVGAGTLSNAGVAGIVLERSERAGAASVAARIVATGGASRTVPVSLTVDGRDLQTIALRVTPGDAAVARFDPVPEPDRPRRARVALPADDFGGDDAWDFVLRPAARLGVLLLSRPGAPAAENVYVRRALGVSREPLLPLVVRAAEAARPGDLSAARVVILHDTPFPTGEAGRRLLEWVARGGGMLIAPGGRGTLPAALADSAGLEARPTDRVERGATAAVVDPAHPAFSGWRGARSDPFAGSRTFRYRAVGGAARALARFDDGSTALAEIRWGQGRILVWSADLANRWSDLPLQPAFVPLLHGAVTWLGGWSRSPVSYEVGDVAEVPRPADADEPVVIERPDGSREPLNDGALVRAELTDRGIHVVRAAGSRTGVLLAAHVPAAESDPARIDPAVLGVAAPGDAPVPRAAGPVAAEEGERRQRFWWYVLAAALLLLGAESLVAHRAGRI